MPSSTDRKINQCKIEIGYHTQQTNVLCANVEHNKRTVSGTNSYSRIYETFYQLLMFNSINYTIFIQYIWNMVHIRFFFIRNAFVLSLFKNIYFGYFFILLQAQRTPNECQTVNKFWIIFVNSARATELTKWDHCVKQLNKWCSNGTERNNCMRCWTKARVIIRWNLLIHNIPSFWIFLFSFIFHR